MEYKFIELKPSTNKNKKFVAVFENLKTKRSKSINFGAKGMKDFILWNKELKPKEAKEKRLLYLGRHKREDWSNSNVMSPAWFSRWFLWEKPTLEASQKFIMSKLKKAGYT